MVNGFSWITLVNICNPLSSFPLTSSINEELLKIAQSDPQYFRPLIDAFEDTNGNVDTLHKLKVLVNDNISLIK